MAVDDKKEIKLRYGPVRPIRTFGASRVTIRSQKMSPSIFFKKWQTKFRKLVFYKYFCKADGSRDPEWTVMFCREGFFHVTHFYNDIYESEINDKEIAGAASGFQECPMVRKPDDLWVDNDNAFIYVATVTAMADTFLQRLTEMKQRGKKYFSWSWQHIPFENRQAINKILEEVEILRGNGAWDVSDEDRENFRQVLSKGEEDMTAAWSSEQKSGRF